VFDGSIIIAPWVALSLLIRELLLVHFIIVVILVTLMTTVLLLSVVEVISIAVPKSHLPSNYKTKLCSQFMNEGHCMYGQRCQFLHSIYDLTDKKNLSYKRGLAEEARLTLQRIQQGSDCIMVNILKGKGCVAPDERLPVFVQIYNKEDYKAELHKQE
jgi:hypothetical protein